MMRKPKEITDDEWESLTSPENYYMDWEVSRAQAEQIFQRKVATLVASRRGLRGPVRVLTTPRTKRLGSTNAAAVSRVLTRARVSGVQVVTAPSKKVIVHGSGVNEAAKRLRAMGYVFVWNDSSILISGRYV